MLVILRLGRQKQEHCEFLTVLGYIVRACLRTKIKRKEKEKRKRKMAIVLIHF